MLLDAFASVWMAHRRAWLIWAVAVTGLALAVIAGYDFLLRRWMVINLADWLNDLQGVDVNEPLGWARLIGFGIVLPWAVGVPVVYWAAGLLLNGQGELTLLLAYPYPRWQVLLGRWLALVLGLMLAIVMGSLPLLLWVGWQQGDWLALLRGQVLVLAVWGVSWANVALCLGIWSGQARLARWSAWLGLLFVWVGVGVGKLVWNSSEQLLGWLLAGVAGMGLVAALWLFERRDILG